MKKVKLLSLGILAAGVVYAVLPTYYHKLINPQNLRRLTNSPSETKKKIALTFDDGPDPRYTGRILDLLEELQIKATFFIVGEKAERHPELVERMIKEGHHIAFHSYEHANGMLKSPGYTKRDFQECRKLSQKYGWDIHLFRPPWGHTNLWSNYYARQNEFHLVYWNVMAQDWSKNATPVTIASKLMKRVKPGAVICLHDSGGAPRAPEHTISALKQALPWLLNQGYEFTGLEDDPIWKLL